MPVTEISTKSCTSYTFKEVWVCTISYLIWGYITGWLLCLIALSTSYWPFSKTGDDASCDKYVFNWHMI